MPSTSLFFLRQINLLSPIRFKKKIFSVSKKLVESKRTKQEMDVLKVWGKGHTNYPVLIDKNQETDGIMTLQQG